MFYSNYPIPLCHCAGLTVWLGTCDSLATCLKSYSSPSSSISSSSLLPGGSYTFINPWIDLRSVIKKVAGKQRLPLITSCLQINCIFLSSTTTFFAFDGPNWISAPYWTFEFITLAIRWWDKLKIKLCSAPGESIYLNLSLKCIDTRISDVFTK